MKMHLWRATQRTTWRKGRDAGGKGEAEWERGIRKGKREWKV